jgi:hypothetical protein
MAISLEETIKDCEEKSHQFNPIAAKQQFQIKQWLEELQNLKRLGVQKSFGSLLIAEKRGTQLEKHSVADDVNFNKHNELVDAIAYCVYDDFKYYPTFWSKENNWILNVQKQRNTLSRVEFKIEMLRTAGAFCAAEIDRIKYLEDIKNVKTTMDAV